MRTCESPEVAWGGGGGGWSGLELTDTLQTKEYFGHNQVFNHIDPNLCVPAPYFYIDRITTQQFYATFNTLKSYRAQCTNQLANILSSLELAEQFKFSYVTILSM